MPKPLITKRKRIFVVKRTAQFRSGEAGAGHVTDRVGGVAAVDELIGGLGMVAVLDRGIGPIKPSDRGLAGGQLVGMASV